MLFVLLLIIAGPGCMHAPLLVVVTDTTRADLGGAPWPAWATPAAGARVYTGAVAPSSWTGPSTAALLTGDVQSWPVDNHHFDPHAPAAGDCWADLLVSDNPFAVSASWAACSPRVGYRYGEPTELPGPRAEEILSVASRKVAARSSPLVVQTLGPHAPLDQTMLGALGQRVSAEEAEGWAEAWPEAYRDAMLDVLPQVGDLISDAVAEGYTVVWTSDHGEALGPDRWDHGLDLEDDQIRVPLAVWGPGVVPGWDDAPVSTLCVADLATGGPCDLRTGDSLRAPVSAMVLDGEWIERGTL